MRARPQIACGRDDPRGVAGGLGYANARYGRQSCASNCVNPLVR